MPIHGLVLLTNEPVEGMQLVINVIIKASLILLLAGALAGALKRSSAATRHLIWSVAIGGLLVLPVLESLLPEWQIPVFPALAQASEVADASDRLQAGDVQLSNSRSLQEPEKARPQAKRSASVRSSESAKPASRKTIDELPMSPPYETPLFEDVQSSARLSTEPAKSALNWALLIFGVWAAGFLSVNLRLLSGTAKVWWIARHAEKLSDDYWRKLTKEIAVQLGLHKEIKVLQSKAVTVPMTWGVWRSVVLLPEEACEWTRDCSRIVLLHELAHIKRRDCLTQLLAQLACAFYWFNPLVWSAAKRLRIERELACDDQVLETGTRATDYASHLVEIASSFEAAVLVSPMTVGMACSQLEQRVVAILNPHIKRRSLNRFRVISAGLTAICLIVPLAIVQPWVSAASLSSADDRFQGDATQSVTSASETEKQMDAYLAKVVEAQTANLLASVERHEDSASHHAEGHSEAFALPVAQEVHENPAGDAEVQEKSVSDTQSDTRPANLTPEQSQHLKMMGITPEFIEAARRLGFDNLTTNQLMQMRVHRIDEEFVRQARGWGFSNLTLNQLVQLRVAGVNTEYVQAMKQAGFENLPVNKLASLRMHNVTPDFINEMRRIGFANLSIEQLLSLRIHNINEAFIKEAETWGFGKLSLDELLQVRVHNITPAFAEEMRSLGFGNLPLNKLFQARVTGVTAAFVNEMRGLGLTDLTLEQVLQMKHQGINAEYVRKLRAAGFKNVSVNQMIDMRIHRIDEILLKNSK
jgi:beta-lactamase regulating signal transducer with metallopeptidase domain